MTAASLHSSKKRVAKECPTAVVMQHVVDSDEGESAINEPDECFMEGTLSFVLTMK